jgi:protein subunit release factor A
MKLYSKLIALCGILAVFSSTSLVAQAPANTSQNNGRTKIVPNVMPFEADKAQLQAVVQKIQDVLTCKETFEDLDAAFMSETEMLEYMQAVGQENAEHVVPFFMDMQKQLKNALKPHFSQTNKVELVYHKQRYGVTERMKVIGLTINIFSKENTPQSMRLQLLEYNGKYRLFSLDS